MLQLVFAVTSGVVERWEGVASGRVLCQADHPGSQVVRALCKQFGEASGSLLFVVIMKNNVKQRTVDM